MIQVIYHENVLVGRLAPYIEQDQGQRDLAPGREIVITKGREGFGLLPGYLGIAVSRQICYKQALIDLEIHDLPGLAGCR